MLKDLHTKDLKGFFDLDNVVTHLRSLWADNLEWRNIDGFA